MNNNPNEIKDLTKKVDELNAKLNQSNDEDKVSDDMKFTYDEYKKKVVEDDIQKLVKFAEKSRAIWFIPLIGILKYSYDLNIAISALDRGVVRQELNKAVFKNALNIFLLVLMFIFYMVMFVFNFYPMIEKVFLKTAIKNSQKRLESNDL